MSELWETPIWWVTASNDDIQNIKHDVLALGFENFEAYIALMESSPHAAEAMRYQKNCWWKTIDDILNHAVNNPHVIIPGPIKDLDSVNIVFFLKNRSFLINHAESVNDIITKPPKKVPMPFPLPWYQFLISIYYNRKANLFILNSDSEHYYMEMSTQEKILNLKTLLLYLSGYTKGEIAMFEEIGAFILDKYCGIYGFDKVDLKDIETYLASCECKNKVNQECDIFM